MQVREEDALSRIPALKTWFRTSRAVVRDSARFLSAILHWLTSVICSAYIFWLFNVAGDAPDQRHHADQLLQRPHQGLHSLSHICNIWRFQSNIKVTSPGEIFITTYSLNCSSPIYFQIILCPLLGAVTYIDEARKNRTFRWESNCWDQLFLSRKFPHS